MRKNPHKTWSLDTRCQQMDHSNSGRETLGEANGNREAQWRKKASQLQRGIGGLT